MDCLVQFSLNHRGVCLFFYTSVSISCITRSSGKGLSAASLLLPASSCTLCFHSGQIQQQWPPLLSFKWFTRSCSGVIMLSSSVGCGWVQKYSRLFSRPLFHLQPLLFDMWVFLGVHCHPRFPRLMVKQKKKNIFNNKALEGHPFDMLVFLF